MMAASWFPSLARRLPGPAAPLILMYHRVARTGPDCDPFRLAVSPDNFEDHLDALRERYTVLPLTDFARRHRDGRLAANTLAITFDDGYACNALVAAPALAARLMPATVFLATGLIGQRLEYWSDELERIVFDPTSRGSAEIRAGSQSIRVDLGFDVDDQDRRASWIEIDSPKTYRQSVSRKLQDLHPGRRRQARSRTRRQSAYMNLWRALKTLGAADQRSAMADLARQTGSTAIPRESHRPMTWDEARVMVSTGGIDIGGHTVTHPSLPTWSAREQDREISDSLDVCSSLTGKPVRTFAYPYGDHSDVTLDVLRRRDVEAACSTVSLPVRTGADPLALPRMQVMDWSGDQLIRVLGDHARRHP
jgi:peptidoglycan/xylan/chitin deacetylase (PgdA/CDA1 family)